jgi:hypothetical protein
VQSVQRVSNLPPQEAEKLLQGVWPAVLLHSRQEIGLQGVPSGIKEVGQRAVVHWLPVCQIVNKTDRSKDAGVRQV